MVMIMQQTLLHPSFSVSFQPLKLNFTTPSRNKNRNWRKPLILCCSDAASCRTNSTPVVSPTNNSGPPVIKKRKRYRKEYPGESKGIVEEMRFVAMKLRNLKGEKYPSSVINDTDADTHSSNDDGVEGIKAKENAGLPLDNTSDGETWKPGMEGFVKYLVDSQLVFNTVERIVDKSEDVAYVYFRKTRLERSEGLSKDLEWFRELDIMIPEASTPGASYAKYLEELAERSAPLFLSHFYNIYFSHIAGGQVIARQVSEKILEGRELEFCRWEGDEQELLKGVREKLNMLGEHWSRDVKNKSLKEAAKSFKFLGQIVRLIIL